MYDTILLPTDGSEHALTAAEHGRRLARLFDATVHVIAVLDLQRTGDVSNSWNDFEAIGSRIEDQRKQAIEAVEATLSEETGVQTAILQGKPVETILRYANTYDVELLVMGTRGRTRSNGQLIGSVTQRVLRRSEAPVLTARAPARCRLEDEYDEILIPTDGSKCAAAAFKDGLAIAREVDASVHAVHVLDLGDISDTLDTELLAYVREQLTSRGEKTTNQLVRAARSVGIDAVSAVREGFPPKNLLDYTEENDIDLIAMGTAGLTGLARYRLGSTTERIIRHADVPVLAVNATLAAGEIDSVSLIS